jgi:hypothetical protein
MHQPFLVSPRNSAAAVADMMKKTNCSRIVTLDHAHHGLIDGIREEIPDRELIIEGLPTLIYAFPRLGYETESDPFYPYPAAPSRPDLDRPAIYIHSSGSTGFPKPIAHSYKVQIHWMRQRRSIVVCCALIVDLWGAQAPLIVFIIYQRCAASASWHSLLSTSMACCFKSTFLLQLSSLLFSIYHALQPIHSRHL